MTVSFFHLALLRICIREYVLLLLIIFTTNTLYNRVFFTMFFLFDIHPNNTDQMITT